MKNDTFMRQYFKDIITSDNSFNIDDFSFVNVANDPVPLKELKKVRSSIISELIEAKPQAIIPVGADITKLILGNVAISKVVSNVVALPDSEEIKVVPCYDPNAATFDSRIKEAVPLTFLALKLAFIEDAVYSKPEIIKIDSEELLKEAIMHFESKSLIGFDIETSGEGKTGGLSPFNKNARILTVAFASESRSYWMDVQYSDPVNPNPHFLALLKSTKDKLVIHNRPFDCMFVKVLTGVFLENTHDSMLVAYLVDENQSKSLKALAFRLLGWAEYAKSVKEATSSSKDFAEVDLETLGTYNALDSAACLHVFNILHKQLNPESLYKFLLDIQNVYILASEQGVSIDLDYIAKYHTRIMEEREALLAEIYNYPEIQEARRIVHALENDLLNKETFLASGKVVPLDKKMFKTMDISDTAFEITKPRHLLALLSVIGSIPTEKTAKGGISLSAKTLESIDHPIVEKFSQVKKYTTIANTFIKGFKEHVKSDGKAHPYFHLCGTVTGRTSCDKPNL